MAKYDTLAQLADAYKKSRVASAWQRETALHDPDYEDGLPRLMLDNDNTFVYAGDTADPEKVFEMHPAVLLDQALSLLGIPHEPV